MSGKKVKCRKCERQITIPTQTTKASPTQRKTLPQKQPASESYWAQPQTGQPAEPSKTDAKPDTTKKKSAKTDSAPITKREKEAVLLNQYSSSSLEKRMAQRRQERIDDGRMSNGIAFIAKGACWLVGAFLLFLLLRMIDEQGFVTTRGFGRRRGLITGLLTLLYLLRAKFWLPPLLALIGAKQLYLGIGALTGKVDIDDQHDFPDWDY